MRVALKLFLKYFLQGLLLFGPLTVTAYVLYKIFYSIDTLIPIEIPGLGIVIIVVGIFFLGLLGSTLLAGPLFGFIDGLMQKIPVASIVYSSVKDFMSAFVGDKKKFTQPVLVKIHASGNLERIGFITETDLSRFGLHDKVAVYFPQSYAFAGDLFVVHKDNIVILDTSSTAVMKFIISGGVTESE